MHLMLLKTCNLFILVSIQHTIISKLIRTVVNGSIMCVNCVVSTSGIIGYVVYLYIIIP